MIKTHYLIGFEHVLRTAPGDFYPLMRRLVSALHLCERETSVVNIWSPFASDELLIEGVLPTRGQPAPQPPPTIVRGNVADAIQATTSATAPARIVAILGCAEHIRIVAETSPQPVQVIGFAGLAGSEASSDVDLRKRLIHICRQHDIPVALSAIDVAETLYALEVATLSWPWSNTSPSIGESIALIPGLNHPLSGLAGRTPAAYHNAPFRPVMDETLSEQQYRQVWRNLAWMRCHQCLWKAVVATVIRAAGMERKEVLAPPVSGRNIPWQWFRLRQR